MKSSLITRLVRRPLNKALGVFGYTLASWNLRPTAAQTIQAAKSNGQSIREYLEELWEQPGCTEHVIQEMRQVGCLEAWDRICEIGPGTGRYLELVLQACSPKQYDIYETAEDWAAYLEKVYRPPVVRQPANGKNLSSTPTASCGLVHAHGVFVYLRSLKAFEYFTEMDRICAPRGYVVFDFFPDKNFTLDMIIQWLTFPGRDPIILPHNLVLQYFQDAGYSLIHEFDNKHSHSYSHYLILRKRG